MFPVERRDMDVKTTQIRLMVEHIEQLWIVTSLDDYGELAKGKAWNRDRAIAACKRMTEQLISGPCEYEIVDISSDN